MSSTILKPFQLLEINVISGQDLQPVSKNMKTYATAWVHKNRKLSTRVDKEGHNSPTWNDKFVFRVDEEFLSNDTSAVMIEIYSVHWFRDTLVGTVRILVGNLIPPIARARRHHQQHHLGMRFVALQVRRPSGRPQGILNIGVALLDSSMRSMPLYTQLSTSAVGYRDLMGQQNSHQNHNHNHNENNLSSNKSNNNPPHVRPILRRSRSERSGRVTFDDLSTVNGSIAGVARKRLTNGNASSMISGSELTDQPKRKGKKGKASSVISGAELREKPKEKGSKMKANSVISGSDNAKHAKPISINFHHPKLHDLIKGKPTHERFGSDLSDSTVEKPLLKPPPKETVIGKPISKFDFGQPKGKLLFGAPGKPNSIWSDSEVGPSPSEVAAAMAGERYPLDDNGSSVLDGWSLDESVEGLRSKLERWRTELPPLYDRGFSTSTFRSTGQHARRHTDGGSGLFSCFSNVYGYECQCICGKPTQTGRSLSARISSPTL
ncbi:uncharacterized protein LOC132274943 [Cornus florida]|uniref:uncharacterized protein LOC132274943 n=1 Tax=Cornus florida TaxID=4283 RepID=UPI0028A286E1|nr:uncharacterized protein LOC132274943 [Cornus florida]